MNTEAGFFSALGNFLKKGYTYGAPMISAGMKAYGENQDLANVAKSVISSGINTFQNRSGQSAPVQSGSGMTNARKQEALKRLNELMGK